MFRKTMEEETKVEEMEMEMKKNNFFLNLIGIN